ncbi:dihydrofolate reductase family protein [uncultured Roseobacter sp.]|uniref:dihydrofolate reductase family protein n=1 Tax=uncultured Roseobacter sp. TaxID=114847 RepID=UPI00262F3759|nr:dihydrofolate reductase family protein [uncultured Roseobacter sp.]
MRELAVLSFVTLDGVMQAPSAPEEDTSGGFAHGGWAAPYWEEAMPEVERTAMSAPYDILFGRKTYDIFASHWPTAPKSDVAEILNSARKHVATSSPDALSWENSETLTGDIVEGVRNLKADAGPLLQVHGSARLIQTLQANDLIDEFRIWTFPVVVGSGKRLFGENSAFMSYALHDFRVLDNGVTQQVFRRE